MPEQARIEEQPIVTTASSYGGDFDGVTEKVQNNYRIRRESRNRAFRFFGHTSQGADRNLLQYIDDGQRRFNSYKTKHAWKEDWQANYVDPITHDKTIAILARLAGQPYKPEYSPRDKKNIIAEFRARLIEAINDYEETVKNNKEKDNFFRLLEAAVKGTIITFEDYGASEIRKTIIREFNPITGVLKSEEKIEVEGGLSSVIVPLEEFYPGNMWENDMRKQTGATWVQTMTKDEFRAAFGQWPNAEDVLKKFESSEVAPEQTTEFKDKDQYYDGLVTVIRDFDTVANEYLIVANDVPLTKKGNRMRWKPGRLPFASSGFEPFSPYFFYYKSFIHRLEQNQDAIDALFNMFLDRTMLAILRPVFAGEGISDELDDPYSLGAIIPVRDVNQIKEMQFSEPGGSALAAINRMEGSIHSSSLDPVAAGISGEGRAKTATEVERATQSAQEILSLFRRFMNWLERDRAELRAYNIAAFYRRPSEIRRAVGSEEDITKWNMAWRKITVGGAKVQTEKGTELGTKLIEIVGSKMELETPEMLERRNRMIEGASEIVQITPETLEEFETQVEIVEVPQFTLTSSLQRAYDREFASVALGRADTFKQDIVAKRFAKAMHQPEDVVIVREEAPAGLEALAAGSPIGAERVAGSQRSPVPQIPAPEQPLAGARSLAPIGEML